MRRAWRRLRASQALIMPNTRPNLAGRRHRHWSGPLPVRSVKPSAHPTQLRILDPTPKWFPDDPWTRRKPSLAGDGHQSSGVTSLRTRWTVSRWVVAMSPSPLLRRWSTGWYGDVTGAEVDEKFVAVHAERGVRNSHVASRADLLVYESPDDGAHRLGIGEPFGERFLGQIGHNRRRELETLQCLVVNHWPHSRQLPSP